MAKAKANAVGLDVLGQKLQKAAETQLGNDKIKELLHKDDDALSALISANTVAMSEAKKQMEENINYIKAKDIVDTFRSSLRDSNKPLKTAIDVAVSVIESRKEAKKEPTGV
jgi:hypothetical protein